MGVGNDPRYNKTRCFDMFPFPDPSAQQKAEIRALGEALDVHRKTQQSAYPDLTMTQMYNALQALREGRPLSEKEKSVHEKGLISVLKDIHDRLDAAVIESYGWPAEISEEEILMHLAALNRERAVEESRGTTRWLRPEFQRTATPAPVQEEMDVQEVSTAAATKTKWPASLSDQMRSVRAALGRADQALTVEQVAAGFKGARRKRIDELLETLVSVGQARATDDGRFAAR